MSDARQDALAVFKQSITKNKAEIAAAMPRNVPGYAYDQVFASAVLAARKSDGLCAPEAFPSLFLALLDVVRLGLTVHWGPAGEAALVPFGKKVQLIIGYRGYAKLLLRSGAVTSIASRVVYRSDDFDFFEDERGPHLLHRPAFVADEVEKIDAVRLWYARAALPSGEMAIRFRTLAKFEAIREAVFAKIKGSSYKTKEQAIAESAYSTAPIEMGEKGPVRDLVKLVPCFDVEAAQEAEERTEREVFGAREPSMAPTPRAQEVSGPALASDTGAETIETPPERVAVERATSSSASATASRPPMFLMEERIAAARAYIGECEMRGVLWERTRLNSFGLTGAETNSLQDAMDSCQAAHEAAQKAVRA